MSGVGKTGIVIKKVKTYFDFYTYTVYWHMMAGDGWAPFNLHMFFKMFAITFLNKMKTTWYNLATIYTIYFTCGILFKGTLRSTTERWTDVAIIPP